MSMCITRREAYAALTQGLTVGYVRVLSEENADVVVRMDDQGRIYNATASEYRLLVGHTLSFATGKHYFIWKEGPNDGLQAYTS